MSFLDLFRRPAPITVVAERDPFPSARVPRADQWESANLGIGTSRDKLADLRLSSSCDLPDEVLRSLYRQNSLAATVVDVVAKELFRAGYEVSGLDVDEDTPEELDVDTAFVQAISWARLYGGSGIIVGANDGRAPWLPLNVDAISSVDYLTPVDKRRLIPTTFFEDPFAPKYGLPEVYQVIGSFAVSSEQRYVHESRVLRFDGDAADFETLRERRSWHLSVLQRCYHAIRDLGFSYQSTLQLMADSSQAVFKLTGLYDQIASGEKDNLQTRMALVDQTRSSLRALLLDKENEDFSREATPLSGIPELLQAYMSRVSSETRIPQTILFGRSPAGMNATGEADSRGWYDMIAGLQKHQVTPNLRKLHRMFASAAGKPTEDVQVKMNPLWTPTATEQATIDKTNADRDNIYITAGVWTSEEVAIQRAKGNTTTVATEIDTDAREAAVDAAVELALDPEAQAALVAPQDPNAQTEQSGGKSGTATPGQGNDPSGQEG